MYFFQASIVDVCISCVENNVISMLRLGVRASAVLMVGSKDHVASRCEVSQKSQVDSR
jgi:hypothetical protein